MNYPVKVDKLKEMPSTVIAFICSDCVLGFSKECDIHTAHETHGIKFLHKNPHGSKPTMLSFMEAVNVGVAYGHGKAMV